MTLERGDLEVRYHWIPDDPGDRWYPGEPAHVELESVTWRGKPVLRIKNRNLQKLEDWCYANETR